MHADRTNRILLLLLALLLITAGATAGAASIGAFGTATRHSPLIANPTGHFIGTQGGWLWPAAAAAAVILALLALRWLLALLFSTDRAGDLPITPGGSAGRTTSLPGPDRGGSRRGRELPGSQLRPGPSPRRPRRPRTRRHRGPGRDRRLRRAASAHRNQGRRPRPLRGRQPIAAHPAGPDRHHKRSTRSPKPRLRTTTRRSRYTMSTRTRPKTPPRKEPAKSRNNSAKRPTTNPSKPKASATRPRRPRGRGEGKRRLQEIARVRQFGRETALETLRRLVARCRSPDHRPAAELGPGRRASPGGSSGLRDRLDRRCTDRRQASTATLDPGPTAVRATRAISAAVSALATACHPVRSGRSTGRCRASPQDRAGVTGRCNRAVTPGSGLLSGPGRA